MQWSPSRLADSAFAPAPEPARVAGLTTLPYAHRGLHGPHAIENSRAAFAAAITRGHGIELDVQASRDGDAFVLHDSRCERLTGQTGAVADRSSDDLATMRLRGCDERVPTLPEILDLIASRVPLLIEVKAPRREVARLCLSVFRALDGYRGPVGVMSFNPEVGRWFAANAPRVTRGLVVTERGKRGAQGTIARSLALWRARPDFLACDIRDLPSSFAARARRRGLPVLTWTVRTDAERGIAAQHADQIIYEGRQ